MHGGPTAVCVVKPAAKLTMPPTEYLFEWLAAAIGRALGVNVPEPLAVSITRQFASSVEDAGACAALGSSLGRAFGSTFEKGFTQIPAQFSLQGALPDEAARVLAFDVYIHNADRQTDNPNLLVARDRLLVFDHEAAFAFLFAIGGGDPVEDDCGDILAKHVLRPLLRRSMPSLDDFAARLAALDDAFFEELVVATPGEWTSGTAVGKIDQVVDVLRRRRDAANRWLPKVEVRVAK